MKNKLLIPVSAVSAMMFPVLAFAQETGTANTSVTSAMTTVANDMVATGQAIVPIALSVVGIGLVVTFGVRLFKRIAK